MEKHVDEEVLITCCKTLEYLCNENVAIQSRCHRSRAKVIDRIILTLRQNLQQLQNEGQDADEEDVAAVGSGFRKVAALSR